MTEQAILPPSTPPLWWSIVSTSNLTAARISVPPEPSCGFRPMLSRALPLARGATPVSRDTARKSESVRPSARCGGCESMPVWMYDFSAFEMEIEVMVQDQL